MKKKEDKREREKKKGKMTISLQHYLDPILKVTPSAATEHQLQHPLALSTPPIGPKDHTPTISSPLLILVLYCPILVDSPCSTTAHTCQMTGRLPKNLLHSLCYLRSNPQGCFQCCNVSFSASLLCPQPPIAASI